MTPADYIHGIWRMQQCNVTKPYQMQLTVMEVLGVEIRFSNPDGCFRDKGERCRLRQKSPVLEYAGALQAPYVGLGSA